MAWGSVPLVGNVHHIEILSERIVRAGTILDPDRNNGDYDDAGGDERLVVRWRTEPPNPNNNSSGNSGDEANGRRERQQQQQQQNNTKNNNNNNNNNNTPSTIPTTTSTSTSHLSDSKNGVNKSLSILLGGETPIFKLSNEEQFTGLFIFSFDEEGRIASHTIEHADDANGWDRTSKFITLTDWLIGKARTSLHPASTGPTTGTGLVCHQYHYQQALEGVLNNENGKDGNSRGR